MSGTESHKKFAGFFRRLSSGAWIACFGVVVTALAWLFVLTMTANDLELEMRRINGENSALARTLEEHVARVVKTTDHALLFLKREYEAHGTTTPRMGNFIDETRQDPLLNQVGVVNSRGDLILSAVPLVKPVNIAHREHFQVQAASDAAGLFVAKPVVNLVSGVWSVFLTRRLNRPDGSFGGVVTAGVDPRYFSDYFDAPELGPGRTIILVGRDGIIRARRFQQQAEVGQDISSSPLFKLIRQAGSGSYEVVSPVDGLPKLASYRAVRETSLIVAVAELKDTALAGFRQRRKTNYTGAFFFTVFTAGFCAALIRSVRLSGRQNIRLAEELAERERSEKKIQLYFEAVEQALDGVQIIDPRGNVIYSNKAVERIYGFAPEALKGKDINEMNVDPGFAAAVILPALGEKGRWSGEIEVWHKDGHQFPVWLSASLIYGVAGEPVAAIGVIRDITERKAAEDKIRRDQEFIKNILDSVDDGFLVVDNNLLIIAANQAFCRQTNRSLGGLLGQPYHTVPHPVLVRCHERGEECPVRMAFATGLPGVAQYRQEDRAGRELATEIKSFPMHDSAGHISSVILTVRDITGKLKMEEQVRSAQKLESVGILAGGIAHDFNNLLGVILGNVSLAKMLLPADEQPRDLLQKAEEACEHGKELSGRLLTFAKGGEPFKKNVQIQKTLRDSVLLALSGSKVSAVFDVAEELSAVAADEGQLRQVFNNLTINAKEAMPDGGTVEVGAENQIVAPGELPALPAGKYVKITFRDQGGGIPRQIVGRIFDPYFSTKQMGSNKGQGLGLTICHSIVKKHEGQIAVATELGRGTVFTIHLPASGCEAAEPGRASARPEDRPQPGGKILVMDDEARVRELLGKMLKHFGYTADLFPDSAGTIRAYQEALAAGVPYSLVILDLTIQGGPGGVETFRDLKDIDPRVRAIISSGYADDPILENFREHGFVGAMPKPYTAERLKTTLASLPQPPA